MKLRCSNSRDRRENSHPTVKASYGAQFLSKTVVLLKAIALPWNEIILRGTIRKDRTISAGDLTE